MEHPDITKKKNDLLKSIMGNPKLSKVMRDAMMAPIGSTKREHAKTVLSIMKKVGGLRHDGMGGPEMPSASSNPNTDAPDYSNLMIFPAAPKFKTRQPVNSPTASDGKGGPDDSSGTSSFNLSAPTPNFSFTDPQNQTAPTPPKIGPDAFSGLASGITSTVGDIGSNVGSAVSSTINSLNPFGSSPNIRFTGGLSPYGTNQTSTPAISGNYGPAATYPNLAGALPGVNTANAAINTAQDTMNNPANSATGQTGTTAPSGTDTGMTPPSTSTRTTTTTPNAGTSSGDQLVKDAQSAVDAGTGPGLFAMTVANGKFGGSLDQYINTLDTKLKDSFNLIPLEDQLTNLKNEKGNLVPTLQTYMAGKDQYLSFVNKMIDQTEGTLLNVNMADPVTAQRYNDQLNYLYTLKGRQNARYGAFLNGAVSDYNADLAGLQTNYDNVYKRYSDALTRGSTMAQSEYNTLYTAMGDLYNNLDQAPTKRLNLQILQQQKDANDLANAKNKIDQANSTNPKFGQDVSDYVKQFLTDQNATGVAQGELDTTKLGAAGLAGYFTGIAHQGGDPQAGIQAVNITMAKALENHPGDMAKVNEFKKMVSDLSNVDGGKPLADAIMPSLAKFSSTQVSDYLKSNIGSVKAALTALVSGKSGWFGSKTKSGLYDKAAWKASFKNIDSGILDDLYNLASKNITPGSAYEKNPSSFINTVLGGGSDAQAATNLASNIMTTW